MNCKDHQDAKLLQEGVPHLETSPFLSLIAYLGEPICINAFANQIAEEMNTHVIHFDDRFELKIGIKEYEQHL